MMMEEMPDGKSPLGIPSQRWRDNVALDLRTLNIDNFEADCEVSHEL